MKNIQAGEGETTVLTGDLIRYHYRGTSIYPSYIKTGERYIKTGEELIEIYRKFEGKTRGELDNAIRDYIGSGTDFKIKRGLARILQTERSEFNILSKAVPCEIRKRLFTITAENFPVTQYPDRIHPVTRGDIIAMVAGEMGLSPEEVEAGLYGDLIENHILTVFQETEPLWLLNRYNLALAQGILYGCTEMRLIAYRNLPVRYKQLFKFIKFYRLMHQVKGDLESGYEILLNGPVSMFKLSRKYGIHMATFLPALLFCTKWKMISDIKCPDGKTRDFSLDDTCGLISHYNDSGEYDSLLEEKFASRFQELNSPWLLERETEIVNLKETVFIPDFTFRHREDNRIAYLEIVGFWSPDYLRRKFKKLQSSSMNTIVAISKDLNVSEEKAKKLPGRHIFFKTALNPKDILEILEEIGKPLELS